MVVLKNNSMKIIKIIDIVLFIGMVSRFGIDLSGKSLKNVSPHELMLSLLAKVLPPDINFHNYLSTTSS